MTKTTAQQLAERSTASAECAHVIVEAEAMPKENPEAYLKGLLAAAQDWARWVRSGSACPEDQDAPDHCAGSDAELRLLKYIDGAFFVRD